MKDLGCRVRGLGFRVQGFGFRAGFKFRDPLKVPSLATSKVPVKIPARVSMKGVSCVYGCSVLRFPQCSYFRASLIRGLYGVWALVLFCLVPGVFRIPVFNFAGRSSVALNRKP